MCYNPLCYVVLEQFHRQISNRGSPNNQMEPSPKVFCEKLQKQICRMSLPYPQCRILLKHTPGRLHFTSISEMQRSGPSYLHQVHSNALYTNCRWTNKIKLEASLFIGAVFNNNSLVLYITTIHWCCI